MIDDVAQIVAARNLVFDLPEDLADFVFDGVRPAGPLLEPMQVGKKLAADEVSKVVTALGLVVINLAILASRCGPFAPAVWLVEDEGVLLSLQRSFIGSILLQAVQVFQEEEPRGLLGVVEFGGAACFFRRTSSIFLKACSTLRSSLTGRSAALGARRSFTEISIRFRV